MKKDFVVIGSQAMKYHFPDFPRIPMDTDIITSRSTFKQVTEDEADIERRTIHKNVSLELADSVVIKYKSLGTTFEYLFSDDVKSLELILNQFCNENSYASPQILYSLKKAHIHFPVKFDKHIKDLMFLRNKLRQIKGVSLYTDLNSVDDLLDSYPALTYLHFQETEKRLGKLKTPKMNQTIEDFFGKSKKYVKSYFVHDNIHLAMAHKRNPMYLNILKPNSEVETDQEFWSYLKLQEKIYCVLEEVYVIALERKILPSLFENTSKIYTPKEAFDWALMRVCTTLCDGFFREFAVKAYDEIQKQYDENYVNKFFNNIYKYEKPELLEISDK